MSDPIIELVGVHKVYEEVQVPALRGISMRVDPGEIVALRGPSGSGKSTLLNIIGCLDRPSRGTYRLGSRDVSQLNREEQAWVRLHFLGFVFQTFHLIPTLTALENVALPLYYAGRSPRDRMTRAHQLLARVGLADRTDHRPSQLSGGQRQRVAIARAVACRPRVLLADEPTGALDTKSGQEVLELLAELHDESGLTIVLVTHDAEVAKFAGREIHVLDGRLSSASEGASGVHA